MAFQDDILGVLLGRVREKMQDYLQGRLQFDIREQNLLFAVYITLNIIFILGLWLIFIVRLERKVSWLIIEVSPDFEALQRDTEYADSEKSGHERRPQT